jgi:hypothetical protein
MKAIQAACPACAAPVRFRVSSSLVVICPYCQSVVARGDRQLADRGKIAAIVETDSPLALGLRGRYRGKSFMVVGHIQYQHSAGGRWDEWFAAFPNDRWGWIAEAQGRLYLTIHKAVSAETKIPSLDRLAVGATLSVPQLGQLLVAEVGQAQIAGAEGEIPFSITPGATHLYADLSGNDGAFGTIDYNQQPPRLYLGQEVTLDDLGLAEAARRKEAAVKPIKALQVSCPRCAGPLALVAPDKTERVCCPNCRSLLDCKQGKLEFLMTLQEGKLEPIVPLGSTGVLGGVSFTTIGFMRRSVTEEGRDYFWSEFLLYNPEVGFRWLVHNEGHFSFVEPIGPGEISFDNLKLTWQEKSFRLFQRGRATVRYVLGEFYWKVAVGEQADTADYVAPPLMLSLEKSVAASVADGAHAQAGKPAEELHCSVGTYIDVETVRAAFGLKHIARGWGVAPNQPSPVDRRVYLNWAGFAGLLILFQVLFAAGLARSSDFGIFVLSLIGVSVLPVGAAIYQWSFESRRWQNSDFSPFHSGEGASGRVSSGWGVLGDLAEALGDDD